MLHFISYHKKFLFASVALVILISLSIFIGYVLNVDTIYKGISLDGYDISGMSLSSARNSFEDSIQRQYSDKNLLLKYGGNSWKLTIEDISLRINTDDAFKNAFILGRSGSILDRLYQIISLRFEAINIKPTMSYKNEKIKSLITEIKKNIDLKEKNASIYYKNGKINIERDIIGKSVPIDKNLQLIENQIIKNNFREINLIVDNIMPEITYNDLTEIDGITAAFKTTFNTSDLNRTHNIRLGCERLNNHIIMPNEIFSMNEALGPRTLENGYREAPVIFRNELVPGTGGGVCQITSTLYNAVLLSRNDIIQRTHHSWPLGYVAPGRDATIAENYIDFKFQNSSGYPMSLNAEVIGNQLCIRILGKVITNGQLVKIKNETLEVYQPDKEEIIIDNSVPVNEKIVIREAKKGYKVVVYREIYNSFGELIDKEKISEDIYKPVNAQIKVNKDYINNYSN